MTTVENAEHSEEQFSRLMEAGANNLAVRKANPSHYWAHRPERKTFITGPRSR